MATIFSGIYFFMVSSPANVLDPPDELLRVKRCQSAVANVFYLSEYRIGSFFAYQKS